MFSVQIDTTMDISCEDQCSVIIRYVTDVVHERYVAIVNCEASTGDYFVQLLKEVTEKLKLDINKCIGNTTDGAANIQAKSKSFLYLLHQHSLNQIHVGCNARILNLVIADTTGWVLASASLFTFLNMIVV